MWLNGYGALTHRVYFGTNRNGVRKANRDSPEYCGKVGNAANVFYLKASLKADDEYFRRVDAKVSLYEVHSGDVWSFTTGDHFEVSQLSIGTVFFFPGILGSQALLLLL